MNIFILKIRRIESGAGVDIKTDTDAGVRDPGKDGISRQIVKIPPGSRI
jgi:hypothetical protein